MVDIETVLASNALIPTVLPSSLVAVFVGGTGGIGEYTLKAFSKYASAPRIFNVGRNDEAGRRIGEECKRLNEHAEYEFIKADTSLLSTVDEVSCALAQKVGHINILVLSTSNVSLGATTAEGLHEPVALTHFTRLRMVLNLLPLIARAPHLRRVVNVLAGGREGPLQSQDIQGRDFRATSLQQLAPHIATLGTLTLERAAALAPSVGFVHSYPGPVRTGLLQKMSEEERAKVEPFYAAHEVPHAESGERHVFLCTSSRYPGAQDREGENGIRGYGVAMDAKGREGGGVYCTSPKCEGTEAVVVEQLGKFRAEFGEKVWNQTIEEFERVRGGVSLVL